MGKAIPVILPSLEFPTKDKALKFFSEKLWSYSPGERLSSTDEVLVRELLQRHQRLSAKIGEGIEYIGVVADDYGDQCFAVFRTDRSFEPFSYKHCVTGYN